jgi:hypothetical protein
MGLRDLAKGPVILFLFSYLKLEGKNIVFNISSTLQNCFNWNNGMINILDLKLLDVFYLC